VEAPGTGAVRGESVGVVALSGEPVEFLGFGNSNVLEQQARDVTTREALDGHTNAISCGLVVASSCWDMLALRGMVKLCIHVVFNIFEESLELDVGVNGSDVDGGAIAAAKDIVE